MNIATRFFSLGVLVCSITAFAGETVEPLVRGHSHNDYYRKQPLFDALERGIWSVEADIFSIDGELRVAHDRPKTEAGKTLEKLYLDPLLERVQANAGPSNNGPGFTLLVDIKDDGEKTYAHLREVLKNYAEMLTSYGPEGVVQRAVTVIISGSRPVETMRGENERLAFVDGRLPDVGKADPALMPLVSMSWNSVFDWRGKEDISDEERSKLEELVKKAHANNQRIRFWGLPWSKKVWPVIYDAGVDLINADNLDRAREFLLEQKAK